MLAYHANSGRLATVNGSLNGGGNPFTYGYVPNSYGLIASVTGPWHTVTNTWESTRDVLQKKENKFVGGSNVSTYEYGVNAIGQRTSVDASGGAFGIGMQIICLSLGAVFGEQDDMKYITDAMSRADSFIK